MINKNTIRTLVFQNESVRFFFKDTQSTFEKSRKMIGVTLRSTWITWAMFMGPLSGARPPIREAIIKNVYISPVSGSVVAGKNTQSVMYYI